MNYLCVVLEELAVRETELLHLREQINFQLAEEINKQFVVTYNACIVVQMCVFINVAGADCCSHSPSIPG